MADYISTLTNQQIEDVLTGVNSVVGIIKKTSENTYTSATPADLAGEGILYTKQQLTEQQKRQARLNIGAGTGGKSNYLWIKYSAVQPTNNSDMKDTPDAWIGFYSGEEEDAPQDYTLYQWNKIKGKDGDRGEAADIINIVYEYAASTSGTTIPSTGWGSNVPIVAAGSFLWSRTRIDFKNDDSVYLYGCSRMGVDGTGSVSKVCGISPDAAGNVALTAAAVGAEPAITTLPIEKGGTGATTAAQARTNLGAAPSICQTANIADNAITANKLAADAVKLKFLNTQVFATSFTADTTILGYGYKGTIPLTGVTDTMIPEVIFDAVEATRGIYAPIAESYNGGIYVYSREIPTSNFVIPTIICWR